MKTLHRLYISTYELDKTKREQATRYYEIPNRLKIENDYRVDPNILDNLVLEADDDIAEWSLRQAVSEYGYHVICLVLSPDEWFDLGIRSSLYGQARVVDGQIITYVKDDSESRDWGTLHQYDVDIKKYFTEATLLEWHELRHGIGRIFNILFPTTHAVFYGYRTADSGKKDARRWRRKPYPKEDWESIDWEQLPNKTPKRSLLMKVLETLQEKLLSLKAEVKQPKGLKPKVKRQAQKVVDEMASYGYKVYVFEGYRTPERQQELYEQGRTTDGDIVTNTKAGESYHNYGVAVDIIFKEWQWNPPHEIYWKLLGAVGKKHGFKWGGEWQSFTDKPHFEMTMDYSIDDFKNDNINHELYA